MQVKTTILEYLLMCFIMQMCFRRRHLLSESFLREEADFWAHIVPDDEGMYQYDAIGNLILDQHEGVQISWTPYGKAREVRVKGDSIVTIFRYDGTGNRIEKKVIRRDTVENIHTTHYVRDASGNVMAIYHDSVMTEQPIYGSSRIGLYKGGRFNGQRSLGEKTYELSNHLGNVLVVITDNIIMNTTDSVRAVVVSTSDYYPFGLEMEGRTYTDTTSNYRYGFNGQEKENGMTGSSGRHYSAEHWVYDSRLGRRWKVDPKPNFFN